MNAEVTVDSIQHLLMPFHATVKTFARGGVDDPIHFRQRPQQSIISQGWSGGAMVLGKLPVPGRPRILITVGQGPTALAVGAGGGCLEIFTLIYHFSPLSPSLWETARYRLKYCLKGPLNPKQTTNQPIISPSVLWTTRP